MVDHSVQQARDLLGVAADSDPATVAHAYRRLARANHPDVSAEPDAAQRFATIAAAYHLLRDHAEPPKADILTRRHPSTRPPIRVFPDEASGPRVPGSLDRTRSQLAAPLFLADLADATPRSGPGRGARWWSDAGLDSPIVAGPVTVTPIRPATAGSPTQGAW